MNETSHAAWLRHTHNGEQTWTPLVLPHDTISKASGLRWMQFIYALRRLGCAAFTLDAEHGSLTSFMNLVLDWMYAYENGSFHRSKT